MAARPDGSSGAGWPVFLVSRIDGRVLKENGMEKSKAEYSLRNSDVGIAAQMVAILGGYFPRIVLVMTVAPELVGVNGLFFTVLGGFMLPNMFLETKKLSEKNVRA